MRTPRPKSKGCSQEASAAGKTRPRNFAIKLGMTSLKRLIKQLGPNSRRKHTIYSISRQSSLAPDSQSLGWEEAQPAVKKLSEQPGRELRGCSRCFPPPPERAGKQRQQERDAGERRSWQTPSPGHRWPPFRAEDIKSSG